MERWVVSDTHFSHSNILTFTTNAGQRVRDFASVEEMDETIIDNWNKIVSPNDIVYHLGDVVINKKFLPQIARCNGSKRLIQGNHDPFQKEYGKYFTKVYAMRIFPRQAILTHVPIHPNSIGRWNVNFHGHTHTESMHDIRYRNCCVDFPGDENYPSNNYTPINLGTFLDTIQDNGQYR